MHSIGYKVSAVGACSVYGLLLLSLGIVLSGAGDGTYLPLFFFSAPLKYASQIAGVLGAFALWLLVGLMLAFATARNVRTGLLVILILHYIGALSIGLTAQAHELGRFTELFGMHPGLFTASFLLYFLGQVVIWFHYSRLRSV